LVGIVAAATATTAVVSTVLTIAVTIVTLSLPLAAIVRGTRHGRGRRSRGVVGVEHLRGRRGRVGADREFLQDQVVSDLMEGQKRHDARDDGSKMIVPVVQPSKNIEDEVAVGDDAAEVNQGVGHALHLATVVAHREVALDEVAEHGVEVNHVCLVVADELVLDHAPDLALGDTVLIGNIHKLIGDRAKDPREDDTLHALTGRVTDVRGIIGDMFNEVLVLQG
jgi:hypothetical protein